MKKESVKREEFIAELLPALECYFRERGIDDVVIKLIGSTMSGKTRPSSDIDLLISRKALSTEQTGITDTPLI